MTSLPTKPSVFGAVADETLEHLLGADHPPTMPPDPPAGGAILAAPSPSADPVDLAPDALPPADPAGAEQDQEVPAATRSRRTKPMWALIGASLVAAAAGVVASFTTIKGGSLVSADPRSNPVVLAAAVVLLLAHVAAWFVPGVDVAEPAEEGEQAAADLSTSVDAVPAVQTPGLDVVDAPASAADDEAHDQAGHADQHRTAALLDRVRAALALVSFDAQRLALVSSAGATTLFGVRSLVAPAEAAFPVALPFLNPLPFALFLVAGFCLALTLGLGARLTWTTREALVDPEAIARGDRFRALTEADDEPEWVHNVPAWSAPSRVQVAQQVEDAYNKVRPNYSPSERRIIESALMEIVTRLE